MMRFIHKQAGKWNPKSHCFSKIDLKKEFLDEMMVMMMMILRFINNCRDMSSEIAMFSKKSFLDYDESFTTKKQTGKKIESKIASLSLNTCR